MSGTSRWLPVVIGFFPTSRGFGWTAFTGPLSLVDLGVFTVRQGQNKNAACLAHLAKILDRLRPETFVIEAFDAQHTRRSDRIRRLCLQIVSEVADRGIELAVFSRGDVQATFATVGARTRDDIAEAVARAIPNLRPLLPPRRKVYASEDKRLGLFNAAALVLTHYYLGSLGLMDEIRGAT
jgi:hypothetical protein